MYEEGILYPHWINDKFIQWQNTYYNINKNGGQHKKSLFQRPNEDSCWGNWIEDFEHETSNEPEEKV